ncbi:hypothetical protein PHAVU_008G057100 [Phaseolus vulgaris]|uniref:RING-type domain-containing protein n=1 Tax=Phaseolus vulgaris TaxID=3885 RepID=V7B4G9_PHAVU|nr:hypothetical protein PHAVU_008G057100g [Phaseolus vulgaris]ESW11758.1 hypothetical protein PHAVU_008G057100g [Phaseolus vulgaris]
MSLLSPSPSVVYNGPPMNSNNAGLDIFTKVFLLILFLSLFIRVCYVYMSLRRDQGANNDNISDSIASMIHNDQNNNNLTGLPFDVVKSYHTFPYSKTNSVATMCDHDSTCAICIEDYEESEMLRMMPQCRHYFHRDCVDAWLKVNATCPVCRNSLKETRSNNDNNINNNGGNAFERV